MAVPNIRPIHLNELSATCCISPDVNYEDVTLIWLDECINENLDCLDTKCRLTTIVNYFKLFDNIHETVDYVRSVPNEHLFLIVSGSLGENLVSQIHNEFQLKYIYVFCMNKENHCRWTCNYEKICGIFIDKFELMHNLTSKVRLYERSLLSMSIFNRTSMITDEHSLRDHIIEGDIGLMWLEVFFDILLRIPLDRNIAKQEMLAECRLYYKNNPTELKKINEFETDYHAETAIHWYSRDSFVYRLVNKALRTLNINIIFKFRFFIIDLYQQLKERHNNYIENLSKIDPNKIIHTVYRSQCIGIHEIEMLEARINSYICPNSFFSTTEDFLMAQSFVAGSCTSDRVLFQIDIPDSYYQNIGQTLKFTSPFLKLDNLSQFNTENEVIFSMGALFRIESVEKYDMWHVCLKLEGQSDELKGSFHIMEEFEHEQRDWQNACSVENRILLLSEKFPESYKNIINIYIKYGVFADSNGLTSEETLNTYRKGFELLIKCLPDYSYLFTVTMYLSIGLLYCNRGERILAMQFGHAALHVIETYLDLDSDCLLICYNYLSVIHQLEDQFTEALSIYETMLSIATKQDNTSALLGIYEEISRITCVFEDHDYEMICLKNIVQLKKKLDCENILDTYYGFGSLYERQDNFRVALYYYKRIFECLLKKHAHIINLMRIYSCIGKMYANYKHYIGALHIYIRILMVELNSVPSFDPSLLRKYETIIKIIQRLIKCRFRKKLKFHFCSLISKSFYSTIFIKFIKKLKFLFYFELNYPISLKKSLTMLLKQISTEYNHRKTYETNLKILKRQIRCILNGNSACLRKNSHNAKILRELPFALNDYQQSLSFIRQAYFSVSYDNNSNVQKSDSSITLCSRDISRVIGTFLRSSHATLCQEPIKLKFRKRHRSSSIFQYQFCGCFKDSSAVFNRFTGRWAKFCQI